MGISDFIPGKALLDAGMHILDKIIPDPAEREKAKLALIESERAGQLDAAKLQMSAILAEANSSDKWTSRARPSFLYVIYILMLASLPMGILFAISPEIAAGVIQGFHNWLDAIPEPYLQLFGVVMLGYTAGRTVEKVKGVS